MTDELYILAATATKKHGLALTRDIVIEYVPARSREEAFKKIGYVVVERHFPRTIWSDPIFRAESVPDPRIRRYREEIRKCSGPVTRLTSLWGFAIYRHDTASIECGTVIAQTKQAATQGVELRLLGRNPRDVFAVEKIPSRLILPRPPDQEDPAEVFRRRFSDIMKK